MYSVCINLKTSIVISQNLKLRAWYRYDRTNQRLLCLRVNNNTRHSLRLYFNPSNEEESNYYY